MRTLVFDTETTGLTRPSIAAIETQPYIIELCAVLLDGDSEIQCRTWFLQPPVKVTKEITKITGITQDMVADAPVFADVCDEILQMFELADEVVAHNLSFDKQMLDIELARCGKTLAWPHVICTVEQTEHLAGFRLSLAALFDFLFGEKFTGAHRAEVDVRATARCFIELRKRGIV